MIQFIKKSFSELEHVVWPTHVESKNFYKTVTLIIVAMALFTFLLTSVFSSGFYALNNWRNGTTNSDISGSPTLTTEIDPASIQINAGSTDGENIKVTPIPVEAAPNQ